MAVKVAYKNGSESVKSHDAKHEDGAGIDVRDGHLHVTPQGSTKALAVYAPGSWISAEVTTK